MKTIKTSSVIACLVKAMIPKSEQPFNNTLLLRFRFSEPGTASYHRYLMLIRTTKELFMLESLNETTIIQQGYSDRRFHLAIHTPVENNFSELIDKSSIKFFDTNADVALEDIRLLYNDQTISKLSRKTVIFAHFGKKIVNLTTLAE